MIPAVEEMARIRKENKKLKEEVEILKKQQRSLQKRASSPFTYLPVSKHSIYGKFAWIHSHKAEYSVMRMCVALKVSRSGYYKYLSNTGMSKVGLIYALEPRALPLFKFDNGIKGGSSEILFTTVLLCVNMAISCCMISNIVDIT